MKSTKEVLQAVKTGEISIDEAEKALRKLSLAEIGRIGMMDLNREERSGIPEVVYAESKTVEHLIHITKEAVGIKDAILLSRVSADKMRTLKENLTDITFEAGGEGDHLTVIAHKEGWSPPESKGKIAVITAGTSDIAYAEETVAIAKFMGVQALTFYDIGVAGIHRIIEPLNTIIEENVDALVVFAGMEGALPTVIASLVDVPVIGVPVPVGYGHGGGGETALASMLQSCALGLAVVNIGNGLGAGAIACLIAKNAARKQE